MTLLWCALTLYGLGLLLMTPSVFRRRSSLPRSALAALVLGLALHGTTLVVAAIQLRRLPVTDVQSALSFLAFDLTLAFVLLYLRYHVPSLGLFMLPFVFVLTFVGAFRADAPFHSPPFRGGWLVTHISAMILGYTGLFLTFVAAVMYLVQAKELKSKQPRAFYYRLPSLEVCDNLYDRSLVFGIIFLSVGILTGVVWASRSWQGPWELDPKILASLAMWLIYLVLFSTRLSGSFQGRRSAYLAIVGFAAMVVTLGASFLSGQHGFFPKP